MIDHITANSAGNSIGKIFIVNFDNKCKENTQAGTWLSSF